MDTYEKILDLKGQKGNLVDEAKALVEAGAMEAYTKKKADIDALSLRISALEALEKEATPKPEKVPGKKPSDAVKAFVDAFRDGFPKGKAMNETTGTEGGYLVPEDISTKVNKLREATFSLRKLVKVSPVSTLSGARTFQTRKTRTGFSLVGEGGTIGAAVKPAFHRIAYAIKKYAGYIPVTNELVDDSDDNIVSILTTWLAESADATDNALILAKLQAEDAVDLVDLDGIKKALTVTLGSAFLGSSSIITNDNGLLYLSTLKDSIGRDLLTPVPSEPGKLQIAIGAHVVPVVIVPNEILPNDEDTDTKIPFIIGDLKEGIELFDRKQLTVATSTTAAIGDLNAFEEDLTILRGILREDVQTRDAAAFVNGYIDTAAESDDIDVTP